MFTVPSLAKLLLLAGIVFFVWKFLSKGRMVTPRRKAPSPASRNSIQDMEPCPQCGSYVSAEAAQDCGKNQCPYG